MRNPLLVVGGIIWLFFIQGATTALSAPNDKSNPDFIEVTLRQGAASTDGAFFAGSSKKAVIMVPGAKYNKESWYFLARHFQTIEISSLALDSGGELPEAIRFIQQKGFKHISVIGGSAGGEAVINEINNSAKNVFEKMVVLAPYGGDPIKDGKLQKLFIIGKKDWVVDYYDIDYLHKKSAEPKKLQVYKKSSAHAQELFETGSRDDLISLIVDFISK